MGGLTDNQQSNITLIAETLQTVSVASIPLALQGSQYSYIPVVLFFCGAVGKSIMQRLGDKPKNELQQFSQILPLLQKFAAMTPDEQKNLINFLNIESQPPVGT